MNKTNIKQDILKTLLNEKIPKVGDYIIELEEVGHIVESMGEEGFITGQLVIREGIQNRVKIVDLGNAKIIEKGFEYLRRMKKDNQNDNKLEPKAFDSRQMLGTATAFLNAANKCNEPSVLQRGFQHRLFIPIVTNLAFSCELFLKVILVESNSFKGGHNLFELFELLSKDIKKDIIDEDDEQEFLNRISRIAFLFEEWRYFYEYRTPSNLEFSFLLNFSNKLFSCASKMVNN